MKAKNCWQIFWSSCIIFVVDESRLTLMWSWWQWCTRKRPVLRWKWTSPRSFRSSRWWWRRWWWPSPARTPGSQARRRRPWNNRVRLRLFLFPSCLWNGSIFGTFRALRSNAKLNSTVSGLGHYVTRAHIKKISTTLHITQPISVLQASFPLLWIQKTWRGLEPQ